MASFLCLINKKMKYTSEKENDKTYNVNMKTIAKIRNEGPTVKEKKTLRYERISKC